MSAKRELSSTLKNLKFMQRATKKDEKPPEEEKPAPPMESGFKNPMGRKCIVIMEGNPHPGAVKGRMSFQNFNPSIDRLNQEDSGSCKPQTTNLNTENQNGEASCRAFSSCISEYSLERKARILLLRSEDSAIASSNHASDIDLKRKQPEHQTENLAYNATRENPISEVDRQTSANRRDFRKPQKREKLDYNLLRRQKLEAKRH